MLRFTIKQRIFLTFTLISAAALYLYTDWLNDSARRHYLEASEEVLYDQLLTMRAFALLDLEQNKIDIPRFKQLFELRTKDLKNDLSAQIYDVKKSGSDSSLYITDSQGVILYHSQKLQAVGTDFRIWRNIRLALKGQYGARATRYFESDPKSSVMHVTLPIEHQSGIIGTITLVKPVKRLSLYLEIARKKIIKTAILTLLFLLLLGYLLTRRIIQPIEDLTSYAAALRDNKRPISPHIPRGELQVLATTIDEMLSKLDGKAYIESYMQTLSHELKSPLAAVHGALELLEGADENQSKKLLSNIRRENQRMTAMVEKILFLSRLENKPLAKDLPLLSIQDLLQNIIQEIQERFPKYQINVTFATPLKTIHADSFLLGVAFTNLLTNAIEFSQVDQTIELSCKEKDSQIQITITDSGSGIPDYAIDKLFDRFYSLPRPSNGRKSSGLGLAIVKEIVYLHKGEIHISNRENQSGVQVTINL